MLQTPDSTESGPRLSDIIRSQRQEIIDNWVARVRSASSPAHDLPAPALIDHLPAILSRLSVMIESGPGAGADLATMPESHAIDRLGRGFDLQDVVGEYALLRRCILDRWEQQADDFIRLSELRRLDAAFDYSISQSIIEYAGARERLLRAVDRIADAAMGSADVDTFLHHLLRVTVETATAVDTVAVLLREGDVLRVRAATGLEREVELGFTLGVGEGFSGTIAAEGKPLALASASTDPLVKSPVLREKGIKALYGVPLVHNGAVIGVAHMGSALAREFSDEDKLLFRTMANRATAVIVQADLVERERRAHRDLQEAHARVVHVVESERQARHEMAEALARVDSLLSASQRATAMREQVLAVVSHDLKNPLSVIHMSTQLLKRSSPTPGQRQLDTIERSLESMDRLIADLLDMASIQNGNLAVNLTPRPAGELITEALQLHESVAQDHGIRLATSTPSPGPTIPSDGRRLQQVFGNLIGNAIKFSPRDSTIRVNATVGDGEVVFSVADQGPGIAPDEISRIFEPYWSGQRHGQKSTGLGLFISQGIVRAHGGRIWVESQPGQGSTFNFALPLTNDQ